MNSLIRGALMALTFAVSVRAEEWTTSYNDAAEGWTSYQYDEFGTLTSKGELFVPGKLGCSGFVAIILHRMKYGARPESTIPPLYKHKVQEANGDTIAGLMGFEKAAEGDLKTVKAAELDGGLYLFSFWEEKMAKDKNGGPVMEPVLDQIGRQLKDKYGKPLMQPKGTGQFHGHTGFIYILGDKWMTCQYTMQSKGYYSGNFDTWYAKSGWNGHNFRLYKIPVKDQKIASSHEALFRATNI